MKTMQHLAIVPAAALAIFLSSSQADAVLASFNGVYTGAGTSTQILVSSGRPASNAVLNNHQTFMSSFIDSTNSISGGVLRVTYSFTETQTTSTFTVNYFDASDGELIGTFTSEMQVEIVTDTATEFESRTIWTMNVTTSATGSFPITSQTVTERFNFNASGTTCIYIFNGVGSVTLTRSVTGTGFSQGSPLIPINPVWTRRTPLNFPVLNPIRTIVCDPPYATSFQYDIAPGRKERFSSVTLPKGFGSGIQLLAQPSGGGALKLVGSYNSGTKIDLLSKSGLEKGTKSFVIRKIKPKVDLKKKAPYPVGVTFTSLDQSAAKIQIQAKQITR
jgi:hypothetical protein